jgi:hypothetical protein
MNLFKNKKLFLIPKRVFTYKHSLVPVISNGTLNSVVNTIHKSNIELDRIRDLEKRIIKLEDELDKEKNNTLLIKKNLTEKTEYLDTLTMIAYGLISFCIFK